MARHNFRVTFNDLPTIAHMGQDWGAEDAERVIDAIGVTCPLPVLMARKALAAMAPGARALIRATDPLARIDIPHFCTEAGHELMAMREADGVLEFLVCRTADGSGG